MLAVAGSAMAWRVAVLAAAGVTTGLAAVALALRKLRVRLQAQGRRTASHLAPWLVQAELTKRSRFYSIVTRLLSTVSIIPNCVRIRPFAVRWCCGSQLNRKVR